MSWCSFPTRRTTMSAAIRGKTAIVGIGSAGVGERRAQRHRTARPGVAQGHCRCRPEAFRHRRDPPPPAPMPFPPCRSPIPGIRPKFVDGTNIGGSSFELHLLQATLALEAGLCDAALICYGSNQRTAGGRLVSMSEPQWHETPYKPRHPITAYALAASRHMHAPVRHHTRAARRGGGLCPAMGQPESRGVRPRAVERR